MHVRRHADRVSTSFYEDGPDVQCIVTVTFDNAVIVGLDDGAIENKARRTLRQYGQTEGSA